MTPTTPTVSWSKWLGFLAAGCLSALLGLALPFACGQGNHAADADIPTKTPAADPLNRSSVGSIRETRHGRSFRCPCGDQHSRPP